MDGFEKVDDASELDLAQRRRRCVLMRANPDGLR